MDVELWTFIHIGLGFAYGAYEVRYLAEDELSLHAEVLAGTEQFVASGAGEAVQMIHAVPRPHHQLLGRDPQLTARTRLHCELPAKHREAACSNALSLPFSLSHSFLSLSRAVLSLLCWLSFLSPLWLPALLSLAPFSRALLLLSSRSPLSLSFLLLVSLAVSRCSLGPIWLSFLSSLSLSSLSLAPFSRCLALLSRSYLALLSLLSGSNLSPSILSLASRVFAPPPSRSSLSLILAPPFSPDSPRSPISLPLPRSPSLPPSPLPRMFGNIVPGLYACRRAPPTV
jgi:hypothetical protein